MVLGLLTYVGATPGDEHKVDWCHYPPGQWTGDPATSKVIILSIDVAAEPGHLTHSFDLGGPCNQTTGENCNEGVTTTGDASGCPGNQGGGG